MINPSEISNIGCGGCPLGGHGWGVTDKLEMQKTVEDCVANGINFIDTSDIYGLGESEILISKAIKNKKRDEFFISSKFGVKYNSNTNKTSYDNSDAWFWNSLHSSLKRLEVDCIDLYQIHYWDEKTDLNDIFNNFDKATKQGKIRFSGITNFFIDSSKQEIPKNFLSFSMLYNLIDQMHENEIDRIIKKDNLKFLSWGSLCQGLLSGKYNKNTQFSLNDRRSKPIYENFHGEKYLKNLKKVELLKTFAKSLNTTTIILSLSWIANRFSNSTVLVGMKNRDELSEIKKALNLKLSEKDIKYIKKIFNS